MEVAKIELDNKLIEYKFSQASLFDSREANCFTIFLCFIGRNYKKKVKFCKNANVCLNISQLIQTFGNEKMNMLNGDTSRHIIFGVFRFLFVCGLR